MDHRLLEESQASKSWTRSREKETWELKLSGSFVDDQPKGIRRVRSSVAQVLEAVQWLNQVDDCDRRLHLRFCECSSFRFSEFRTLSIVAFRKRDCSWRDRGVWKGDLSEFVQNDERERGRERRKWRLVEP